MSMMDIINEMNESLRNLDMDTFNEKIAEFEKGINEVSELIYSREDLSNNQKDVFSRTLDEVNDSLESSFKILKSRISKQKSDIQKAVNDTLNVITGMQSTDVRTAYNEKKLDMLGLSDRQMAEVEQAIRKERAMLEAREKEIRAMGETRKLMSENAMNKFAIVDPQSAAELKKQRKIVEESENKQIEAIMKKQKLEAELKKSSSDSQKLRITQQITDAETEINNLYKDRKEQYEALLKSRQKMMNTVGVDDEGNKREKKEVSEWGRIKKNMAMMSGVIASFTTVGRLVGNMIGRIAYFEDRVYQLGVTADMTTSNIKKMRTELMLMATDTRYSAAQIANAQDTVARTGLSLADSQRMVAGALNLATANFETLHFAATTLTKSLVAFQIDSNRATESVNILHSAVLQTPLSLKMMDEAMRQSGASFSSIIEMTEKAGDELEDYKVKLFKINAALIGGMSLIGKTGSQSGTSIKMMNTKLLAMEKTAKALFDAEMAARNIQDVQADKIGTGMFSADKLAELAKIDYSLALEELSKLYMQGQVSYGAITKMFGARHASQITSIFAQINGDLDGFTKRMAEGRDASIDAQKAMTSWSSEMAKSRNVLDALSGGFSSVLDIMLPILTALNDFGAKIAALSSSSIGSVAVDLAGVATSLFAMDMAFSSLMKSMTFLEKFKIFKAINGSGGILASMNKAIITAKNGVVDFDKSMSGLIVGTSNVGNAFKALFTGIKSQMSSLWVLIKANAPLIILTSVLYGVSKLHSAYKNVREEYAKLASDAKKANELLNSSTIAYERSLENLETSKISDMVKEWYEMSNAIKSNLESLEMYQKMLTATQKMTTFNLYEVPKFTTVDEYIDDEISSLKKTEDYAKNPAKFISDIENKVSLKNKLSNMTPDEMIKFSNDNMKNFILKETGYKVKDDDELKKIIEIGKDYFADSFAQVNVLTKDIRDFLNANLKEGYDDSHIDATQQYGLYGKVDEYIEKLSKLEQTPAVVENIEKLNRLSEINKNIDYSKLNSKVFSSVFGLFDNVKGKKEQQEYNDIRNISTGVRNKQTEAINAELQARQNQVNALNDYSKYIGDIINQYGNKHIRTGNANSVDDVKSELKAPYEKYNMSGYDVYDKKIASVGENVVKNGIMSLEQFKDYVVKAFNSGNIDEYLNKINSINESFNNMNYVLKNNKAVMDDVSNMFGIENIIGLDPKSDDYKKFVSNYNKLKDSTSKENTVRKFIDNKYNTNESKISLLSKSGVNVTKNNGESDSDYNDRIKKAFEKFSNETVATIINSLNNYDADEAINNYKNKYGAVSDSINKNIDLNSKLKDAINYDVETDNIVNSINRLILSIDNHGNVFNNAKAELSYNTKSKLDSSYESNSASSQKEILVAQGNLIKTIRENKTGDNNFEKISSETDKLVSALMNAKLLELKYIKELRQLQIEQRKEAEKHINNMAKISLSNTRDSYNEFGIEGDSRAMFMIEKLEKDLEFKSRDIEIKAEEAQEALDKEMYNKLTNAINDQILSIYQDMLATVDLTEEISKLSGDLKRLAPEVKKPSDSTNGEQSKTDKTREEINKIISDLSKNSNLPSNVDGGAKYRREEYELEKSNSDRLMSIRDEKNKIQSDKLIELNKKIVNNYRKGIGMKDTEIDVKRTDFNIAESMFELNKKYIENEINKISSDVPNVNSPKSVNDDIKTVEAREKVESLRNSLVVQEIELIKKKNQLMNDELNNITSKIKDNAEFGHRYNLSKNLDRNSKYASMVDTTGVVSSFYDILKSRTEYSNNTNDMNSYFKDMYELVMKNSNDDKYKDIANELKNVSSANEFNSKFSGLSKDALQGRLGDFGVEVFKTVRAYAEKNSDLELEISEKSINALQNVIDSIGANVGDMFDNMISGDVGNIKIKHGQFINSFINSMAGYVSSKTAYNSNGDLNNIISKYSNPDDYAMNMMGISSSDNLSDNDRNTFETYKSEYNGIAGAKMDSDVAKVDAIVKTVGASIALIDGMYQMELNQRAKALDYEKQMLDIKYNMARNDKDREEIARQQLDLEKRKLQIQFEQQTGFMGMTGSTGGFLNGAVGGGMNGASLGATIGMIGGPAGALVGAGIGAVAGGLLGGIGGAISGSNASKQKAEQEQMLENQYEAMELDRARNRLLEQQNNVFKDFADMIVDYGSLAAMRYTLETNMDGLEGAGTSYWNDRSWHGRKGGWKSHQALETEVKKIEDFGFKTDDVNTITELKNVKDTISKEYESMEKQYGYLRNMDWSSKKDGWMGKKEAELNATEALLKNLEAIIELAEKTSYSLLAQHFGFAMKEIYDEADEDLIIGYEMGEWEGASDVLTSMVDSIGNDFTSVGESFGGMLMAGIKNIIVKENETISNLLFGDENGKGGIEETLKSMFDKDGINSILNYGSKDNDNARVDVWFDDLIGKLGSLKDEQNKVNDAFDNFVQIWLDKGGDLSDIIDSVGDGLKGIYEGITEGLKAESFDDMAGSFGDMLGNRVADSYIKSFLDKVQNSQMLKNLDNAVSEAINNNNFSLIQGASNQALAMLTMFENERQRMESIMSMFNFDQSIEYTNEDNKIQYETGSTKEIVYNTTITNEFYIGNYVGDEESKQMLSDSIVDNMIVSMKDKGVDIFE